MSEPWFRERYCAVDLETTSAEPEEARIVTCSVVEVSGGQPTVEHFWVCQPLVRIPEEAFLIHGYDDERVAVEGRPTPVALREALDVLAGHVALGHPVVAFNARYDLTVLDREARRCDLTPLQERGELRVVDPLVVDKHIDRYRKGSRRLVDMAGHYKARLDGAHDATFDAMAAARLAWAIAMRGRIIRNRGDSRKLEAEWARARYRLDDLHYCQQRWAAFQAEGLERYFTEKGEPQPVPRDWPFISPPVPVDQSPLF